LVRPQRWRWAFFPAAPFHVRACFSKEKIVMAEAKSRRDPATARPRVRVKTDTTTPDDDIRDEDLRLHAGLDEPAPASESETPGLAPETQTAVAAPPIVTPPVVTPPPVHTPRLVVTPPPTRQGQSSDADEAGYRGFDEEINSRYEE